MDSNNHESRRKYPRYSLNKRIRVVNRQTGESLGLIANLSQGGLMLVDSSPLVADGIYQLAVELESGVIGNSEPCVIELGVDCLWNSPAADQKSDAYWSGCEIIDISDEHLSLMDRLIAVVRSSE
ncbi:MAG TPA: PilZ domain-containing protein [Pseudomonadales bacterium]|jgi:hypothetical protein